MADIMKTILEIRLSLQADGADVELLELNKDGGLKLKTSGKSKGCNFISISLQEAIKSYILRANPETKYIDFLE